MEKLFFDSWDSVLRIFLIAVLSYLGLISLLRVAGSRTLSQLNAFDFIVTVALGSTLATVILNKDVPLVDGLLALALLIALQFAISKASTSFKTFRKLIKTEPFLLFYKGHYLPRALRKSRITEDEVLQMVRSNGAGSMEDVDAIVLETNGNFSVIKKSAKKEMSSIGNVAAVNKGIPSNQEIERRKSQK